MPNAIFFGNLVMIYFLQQKLWNEWWECIYFYPRHNKWNNCLVKTEPPIVWENYIIFLYLMVSDFWIPKCTVPFNIRILALINYHPFDLFLLLLAFLIFGELNDFKVCIFTALKNNGIMRFVKIKHFSSRKLQHIIICQWYWCQNTLIWIIFLPKLVLILFSPIYFFFKAKSTS